MFFWYKFLSYLFYPFSNFFLFLRKLKKKEHQDRYSEKIAKIKIKRRDGFLIWFHVASVGEAMSILPLIENLETEEKVNTILITSITLSSGQILEKKYNNKKKIIHQFLPLDVPFFVDKFLNHWSPNLSIFIDSEIWPNLIYSIKKRNIPLLLINGRISKKTFLKWSFFKNFAKKVFEKFDLCIASNKESENYLRMLGTKNIKNYGNLKFTKTKSSSDNFSDKDLEKRLKNRKIWCAASTHSTEELFCAKTHLELKKNYKNILTIIIPRHISRVKKIIDELSTLNLKVSLYSDMEYLNNDVDILLIDSYGEALKFYQISKCVFLGKSTIKSLINDSGQNPLEPSMAGCKIFHGPYVSNFNDEYKYLNSLGVTKKIHDSNELEKSLIEEFQINNNKNVNISQKIKEYGETILNNVIKEIKIYINK
jgi:3-deoxy-D-manno-octulosonic-acid transferase